VSTLPLDLNIVECNFEHSNHFASSNPKCQTSLCWGGRGYKTDFLPVRDIRQFSWWLFQRVVSVYWHPANARVTVPPLENEVLIVSTSSKNEKNCGKRPGWASQIFAVVPWQGNTIGWGRSNVGRQELDEPCDGDNKESHITKKCLVFMINSEPIMAKAYSQWPASCATCSCSLHFVSRQWATLRCSLISQSVVLPLAGLRLRLVKAW